MMLNNHSLLLDTTTTTNTTNNSRHNSELLTSTINNNNNGDDDKDDISATFSNLNIGNNESNNDNDKFCWSGMDVAANAATNITNNNLNENFTNHQHYVAAATDNGLQFSDQSLVQKLQVQNQSGQQQQINLSKISMNYGSSLNRSLLLASPNSSLYNNNNNNNTSNNNAVIQQNNNNKSSNPINWPRSSSQINSSSTNGMNCWSNAAFTTNYPVSSVYPSNSSNIVSSSSSPSASSSSPNAWSNVLYNPQQQKRNPHQFSINNQNLMANTTVANNNNNNNTGKRSFFPNDNQFFINEANQKLRRQTAMMMPAKNYPTSCLPGGQTTNTYELNSAGSDNTSSSSDSANLRENGLFFHDKNFEQTPILDSFTRTALVDPHPLCDALKSSQEANKNIFNNYACQPNLQDDKKHLAKGRFNRKRGKSPFFTGNDTESLFSEFPMSSTDPNERFSRKVFVGGLPPDIDEEEITASFRRFGHLVVDWPHKAESKSYFPPKGYAFLLFQDESSVQSLIDCCIEEEDKLYLCVSSPTMKDKPVQIRPWRLSDADYVLDASMPLDPRKTVFVGGVPRPLKAVELAMIMDRLYGGVCYAGIDTDPELKYPKGAGRVAFSNQQSYIAAISARFVQLQHADIEKRVEVKPYVLDDQICDECQGARCNGKYAPYFCANITCLQYYCENCWATIHSRPGREFHKPLVKEGADRPRAIPFRWC
uniref:Cytoplasmic polyadenylation element-binding protein 4-like n=1 Tax=Dermatophagoides pteronyssinus TaxID=6956 RepID=A0A6P6XVD4_DERPT|nr:cytoplasmic polyadenylation element-binding protein 4-like [Dermatophagoides pteronyssinus]